MDSTVLHEEDASHEIDRASTPSTESSGRSDESISIDSTLFSRLDTCPLDSLPPLSLIDGLRVRFLDGPPIDTIPAGPDSGVGYTRRPTSIRISVSETRPSQEFVRSIEPSVQFPNQQKRPQGRYRVARLCEKAFHGLTVHHDQSNDHESAYHRASSDRHPLQSPTFSSSSTASSPQTAAFSSFLFDSSTSTATRQTPISCRNPRAGGIALGKVSARVKRAYPRPLLLPTIQGSPNPASTPTKGLLPTQKGHPITSAFNWLRRHVHSPPTPASVTSQPSTSDSILDTAVASATTKKRSVRIASLPTRPLDPATTPIDQVYSHDEAPRRTITQEMKSILKFSHPSKTLFFLGFVCGPWCFLIGGFFLSKTGGCPLMDRDGKVTTSFIVNTMKRRRPVTHSRRASDWDTRERLSSLPPSLVQSNSTRPPSSSISPIQEGCAWVRRCRVASAASGLLIMVAISVAIAVIVTHGQVS